ncbi:cyd operon YbgE family protein [Pseudomonas morbosilactucae]|uniref:cyd operon YbgE family protein n=1 Tax=Pseudomonas morbosilactucae TaxID=2938197 RepID=UPI003CC50E14
MPRAPFGHGGFFMWGICAGFIHGIGFQSASSWFRLMISSILVWPLLLATYLMLAILQWR